MSESHLPEQVRLFIAITIPVPIKQEIEKAQKHLRGIVHEGAVRWATSEQFHVTLRFLGNVHSNRIEALQEVLQQACGPFPQLRLQAKGLGFFPRPRSPRVIWVGIGGAEEQLRELHAAVQDVTDDFTTEEREDRFKGHITIGRVKALRPVESEALAKAGQEMGQKLIGEWQATEVELIRSQLSPQGARYKTIASVPFRG